MESSIIAWEVIGMKKFMIVMIACILTGCAINSALKQRSVDMSVVKVGAKQYEIENQLGNALETKTEGNTKTCLYYVESGDPSAGRAALHAIGDYYTLGLWEIVGSKMEASHIRKFKFSITYVDDTCTNIESLPLETEKPRDTEKGMENQKP